MEDWPHQKRTYDEILRLVAAGHHKIAVTIPTGGGKGRIIVRLAQYASSLGKGTAVYVNRRLLTDQTSGVFDDHGIIHGVRAAGWKDERELRVQVCSVQTEGSRQLRREGLKQWDIHECLFAIFDEAHLFANATGKRLIDKHVQRGHVCVGFTATPLDMGGLFDVLLIGATNSELRACGAIVPARHYGCEEPDLRSIGKVSLDGGDLTEQQQRKAMGSVSPDGKPDIKIHKLFGRVFAEFRRLNPEQRPTILFAPGVAESAWFAQEFYRRGVSAAHIDGERIWVDGEWYHSDHKVREEMLDGSRTGRIKVVCNRFVLREGVDAPWLSHGILATAFGSVQSYLQSCGRLLRSGGGSEWVTIQDHGGNYLRPGLGSVNADRQWELGMTARSYAGVKEARMRKPDGDPDKEPEPFLCPRCKMVTRSATCQSCGFVIAGRRVRFVMGSDGDLREYHGDAYRPLPTARRPDTAELWEKVFWQMRNAKKPKTFRQIVGWFVQQHGYRPPADLPFMPRAELDWFRNVRDVPINQLRGKDG